MALTRIKLNQITQPLDQDLNVPNLSASGNITTTGDLTVGGNTSITGSLTVDGSVSFSSSNTVGTFTFGDGDQLQFGDSQDLRIYHSGAHSFITDGGQGDLKILGANIEIGALDSSLNFKAISGGATSLYYNGGTAKLTTTTTGISVTGLTDTDTLYVSSTATIGNATNISNAGANSLQVGNTGGSRGITILSANTGSSSIYFADNQNNDAGYISYNHAVDGLFISTNRGTALGISSSGDLTVSGTLQTSKLDSTSFLTVFEDSQASAWSDQRLRIYGFDSTANTAKYGELRVASDGSFMVVAQDTYLQLSAANYIQSNSNHNFTANILFSGDTNLYRVAANHLKTDDSFTVGNNLTVNGNFTVSGNTTFVNSDNLQIEDKNITLGVGANTTTLLDGTGFTFGDDLRHLTYTNAGDALNSDMNLVIKTPKTFVSNTASTMSNIPLLVREPVGDGTAYSDFTLKFTREYSSTTDIGTAYYMGYGAVDTSNAGGYIRFMASDSGLNSVGQLPVMMGEGSNRAFGIDYYDRVHIGVPLVNGTTSILPTQALNITNPDPVIGFIDSLGGYTATAPYAEIDANNGNFVISADPYQHTANSSITLKVDNTNVLTAIGGNVGINTSSPVTYSSAKLAVVGDSSNTNSYGISIVNPSDDINGSTTARIGAWIGDTSKAEVGSIGWTRTASAYHESLFGITTRERNTGTLKTRLVIDALGNVGIGTNTPDGSFHSTVSITPASTVVNEVADYNDAFIISPKQGTTLGDRLPLVMNVGNQDSPHISTVIEAGRYGSGWETYLAVLTNGVTSGPEGIDAIQEVARFNATGLGINTTTPNTFLEVAGPASTNTTGVEQVFRLSRAQTNGQSFYQFADFKLGRFADSGGAYQAFTRLDIDLRDDTTDNNAFNKVLTLTNQGRVGINEQLPLNPLHIYVDTASTQAFSTTGNGGAIFIESNSSSGALSYGSAINFTRKDGSSHRRKAAIVSKQYGGDGEDVGLAFFTANGNYGSDSNIGEVLQLRGDGNAIFNNNIGIGHDNPSAGLHIKKQGRNFSEHAFYDGYESDNGLGGSADSIVGSQVGERTHTLILESDSAPGIDVGASIGFRARSSDPSLSLGDVTYGAIVGAKENDIVDNPDGTYDDQSLGYLGFYTSSGYTFSPHYGTLNYERMRLTSAGRLGIRNTAPEADLHIGSGTSDTFIMLDKPSGGNNGIIFRNAGNNKIKLIQDASEHFRIYVNNLLKMSILENGNVGIGDHEPSHKLHINNGGIYINGTNGSDYVVIGDSSDYPITNGAPAMLHLAGTTNAGFNTGANRKIFITDYDNDTTGTGGVVIFEAETENQETDFKFTGRWSGLPSEAYFSGNVDIDGALTAASKSFDIEHPTKEGMRLHHGSLEGPEHGVYVRGRLTDSNVIELPDYWTGLVDEDTITVQLTAIGGKQNLWVEDIVDNSIVVGFEDKVNCFYFVQAERKDVDKFDVEYEA
jgi:hypothetical protein